MNQWIRVPEVRVVLEDGEQLGVMSSDDARAKARELGLDLVEISPHARPPVCKIIDAGKWKYDQSTTVQLKQIKLRPKTDEHDMAFKVKHARRFLDEGNKVQFVVRFRGRENAHPETGRAALDKILLALVDVAKLERIPKYENRMMTMVVGPK